MTEKRSSKRIDVDMKLKISDLFKQDNVKIGNIDAPITVTNISKTGIGFITDALLPVGYYFNTKLTLGDENALLYTVVQIVRVEAKDDTMYYGAKFIGLAPILDIIFEDFNPGWDD